MSSVETFVISFQYNMFNFDPITFETEEIERRKTEREIGKMREIDFKMTKICNKVRYEDMGQKDKKINVQQS